MSTATAGDPTLEIFQRFARPELWSIKQNVPIFCAHKRKGKDGKVIYEVGDREMERICAHYRKLEKESGVVPRIAIGHTDPDAPEKDQPEVIGFARNLRIGTFGPGRKKAILCDEWVEKAQEGERRKYPYRSVEFYPGRMEIAGVSLLKRDPQLDLGIVLYQHADPVVRHLYLDHRAGDRAAWPVLYSRLHDRLDPLAERLDNDWLLTNDRERLVCYQREIQDMAEEKKDDPTKPPVAVTPEKPEELAADPPDDDEEMEEEEAEEYARHCYSHPAATKYARHMAKKYAMSATPAMPGGGGMANLPAPGEPPAEAMRRREESQRYARMEKEVNQLKRNLAEVTAASQAKEMALRTEKRRGDLQRYKRDLGVRMDVEEELKDCIDLSDEQYTRFLKKLERYERDPAGGPGALRIAEDGEGDTGIMSPETMERCMTYQRAEERAGRECSWDEAILKVTGKASA